MRSMVWATALILASLAGCAVTDDEDSEPAGNGSISVYIKDAPTDEFEEIHVVFSEVRVRFAGQDNGTGGNETDPGNGTDPDVGLGDEDDEEWVTVFSSNGTDIDLLATEGPRAAFLGESDAQVGNYTAITFTIDSAYGIDQNGTEHDFDVESDEVETELEFEVRDGLEALVLIDIDLDGSLEKEEGELPVLDEDTWTLDVVLDSVTVFHVEDGQSGEDVHGEGVIAELEQAENGEGEQEEA